VLRLGNQIGLRGPHVEAFLGKPGEGGEHLGITPMFGIGPFGPRAGLAPTAPYPEVHGRQRKKEKRVSVSKMAHCVGCFMTRNQLLVLDAGFVELRRPGGS
jgi:hypothetical protein